VGAKKLAFEIPGKENFFGELDGRLPSPRDETMSVGGGDIMAC
jgi:hypothetical protein